LKVMSISLSPKLSNGAIRGYCKISNPTATRSNSLDRKIDVMGGVDVLGDIVTRALHPDFPENICFAVFIIHVAFKGGIEIKSLATCVGKLPVPDNLLPKKRVQWLNNIFLVV
jgi:hypothetical protein